KVAIASGATAGSIFTTPRPVNPTSAGLTYNASAWVRTDAAGRSVCLYIREWSSAGAIVSSANGCVPATSTWQQFPTVSYTTKQSGGTLEVFVYEGSATSGDTFEIDTVTLTQGSAPEPPPPAPTALLSNGTFESGLDGWAGWQGALSVASDGHDGTQAA